MVLFPLSISLSLLSTTIISGCSPQKVFSWIISPSNSPRLGRHLLTCNQTVINEGGRGGGEAATQRVGDTPLFLVSGWRYTANFGIRTEIHRYYWYSEGDTPLSLVYGQRYTTIFGIRMEIHRYKPLFLVSGRRYTAIFGIRTEIPRYFWYPDRDNVLLVSRWRYTAMFGIQTEINHYFWYPDGETRLFW